MKTRFAHITLSVIAALVLLSCEKNEISHPDDFGEPNLTIHLNTDLSLVTKTAGAKEDSASVAEKKISSVSVFLAPADENGTPIPNTSLIKIDDNMMKFDGGTIDAKVFGLSSNYHLLYVLANCPSNLIVKTDSLPAFIGSYNYVDTTVLNNFWKKDNFFMVNGVEGNAGTKNKCGGVFVDFSSSVKTTVTLERMAAKIIAGQDKFIDFTANRQKVYGEDDEHGYAVSSAVIDSWALLNCVKSFNLIQSSGTDTKHQKTAPVIVTPSSSNDYPPVLLTPGDASTNLKSAGYYYTNPAVSPSTGSTKPYVDLEFVSAGDSLYCLENNPDYYVQGYIKKSTNKTGTPSVSDSKMKGRVTAVVFRAKMLLADGFDGYLNIDEPIHYPNDPDQNGNWKDGYPKTKAETNIEKTIYAYKGQMYADKNRLKDMNSELSICGDDAALRDAGVKVYENGYMYYTYYISKNDFADNTNVAPYYCVERNKVYRLTVESVSSFGDDQPCDFTHYDPEDPIDRAVPRIKVKVDVLPWNVIPTQTYEIK